MAIARAVEQFEVGRDEVDEDITYDKAFELCCFLCTCGGEGHTSQVSAVFVPYFLFLANIKIAQRSPA